MQVTSDGYTIDFLDAIQAYKFDETNKNSPYYHGLSHCMKAIDIYVEYEDKILFVEIKDYSSILREIENEQNAFWQKVQNNLIQKFRDSFLYCWAESKSNIESIYYIVCLQGLPKNREFFSFPGFRKKLCEHLPLFNVPSRWKKQLLKGCFVVSLDYWKNPGKPLFSLFPIEVI